MSKMTTSEIEDLANELLTRHLIYIFKDLNYTLRPYQLSRLKEKGIDCKYEIETRENPSKTDGFFNVQNKGTFDKVQILKSTKNIGKISFKLEDVRQVDYFCFELDEPLIFFLCDLDNKDIYWYPIQLDSRELRPRVEEVRNKVAIKEKLTKSIQIYFSPEKILCKGDKIVNDNVMSFLEDIKKSYAHQQYIRENRLLTSGNSFDNIEYAINAETKDKNPIEAISILAERFGHFKVLPIHILRKLFPFYNGEKEGSYSNGTFVTFNKYLINAYKEIRRENEDYFNAGIKITKQELEHLEKSLSFLKFNIINHLSYTRQHQDRICLHTLFYYKGCNCMSCSISKLNYKNTIESIVSENFKESGILYAFSLIELGLLREAYYEFDKLSGEYLKAGDYSGYFISRFNLDKMKYIIRHYVEEDDEHEINRIKSSVNLKIDLNLIRANASYEIAVLAEWIQDDSFINNTIYELEALLEEIKNHYQSDQYGGWSSHHKDELIFNEILRLTIFIEGNSLFFTGYLEFKQAISKSIEGLLACHQILNKSSTHFKNFDDYIIGLILFYVEPENLIDLLRRYHVDKIRYQLNEHNNSVAFNIRIKNLSNSISTINKFLERNSKGRYNTFLEQKIENHISNGLIILKILELEESKFNTILDDLVNIIINYNSLNHSGVFKHLSQLINKKIDQINENNISKLIEVIRSYKNPFLSQEIDLPMLLKKSNNQNTKERILNEVMDSCNGDNPNFQYALEFIEHFTYKQKQELSKLITKSLKKNFDSSLFYYSVINDLINYSDFENEYLKTISLQPGEMTFRQVFGDKKDNLNHKLNELINIAYKLDLKLTDKRYDDIFIDSQYYKWLRDPVKFDYVHFDCYWILEYQTSIYFKKFSKIDKIKSALSVELRKRPIEGLLRIYIDYF
jgi:hypothetical protein